MKQFGFSKFQLLDSIVSFSTHSKVPSFQITPKCSKSNIKIKKNHLSESLIIEQPKNDTQPQNELSSKLPNQKIQKRVKRHSSVIGPSINFYLEQIEIAKSNNLQSKQEVSRLLTNVGQYVAQIKSEQKTKPFQVTKNTVPSEPKFKRISLLDNGPGGMISNKSLKISSHELARSKSCLSEESTTRKIYETDSHNCCTAQMGDSKIKAAVSIALIRELYNKVDILKKLWQNENRLEKFIRQKTSLKPELYQILFPNEEIKAFHQGFQQFQKLFYNNKFCLMENNSTIIGCQMKDVTQAINRILEQQKFQELVDLKSSIKQSSGIIKLLENHSVIQKFTPKKDYDYLSFQSLLMSNENKDKNLDKMELQLGPLKKVENENRKMSQVINNTIHELVRFI